MICPLPRRVLPQTVRRLFYRRGTGCAIYSIATPAKVRAKEQAILAGKFSVKVDDTQPKSTAK